MMCLPLLVLQVIISEDKCIRHWLTTTTAALCNGFWSTAIDNWRMGNCMIVAGVGLLGVLHKAN